MDLLTLLVIDQNGWDGNWECQIRVVLRSHSNTFTLVLVQYRDDFYQIPDEWRVSYFFLRKGPDFSGVYLTGGRRRGPRTTGCEEKWERFGVRHVTSRFSDLRPRSDGPELKTELVNHRDTGTRWMNSKDMELQGIIILSYYYHGSSIYGWVNSLKHIPFKKFITNLISLVTIILRVESGRSPVKVNDKEDGPCKRVVQK